MTSASPSRLRSSDTGQAASSSADGLHASPTLALTCGFTLPSRPFSGTPPQRRAAGEQAGPCGQRTPPGPPPALQGLGSPAVSRHQPDTSGREPATGPSPPTSRPPASNGAATGAKLIERPPGTKSSLRPPRPARRTYGDRRPTARVADMAAAAAPTGDRHRTGQVALRSCRIADVARPHIHAVLGIFDRTRWPR